MYKTKDLFRTSSSKLKTQQQASLNSSISEAQYVIVHNVNLTEIAKIRNLITGTGCRVKITDQFAEMGEICSELIPSMVVSDCSKSPEESLLQYQGIRKIQGMERTPILFLYNNSSKRKPQLHKDADNYQFMFKPIHPKKFRMQLVSLLEHRKDDEAIAETSQSKVADDPTPTPFFPEVKELSPELKQAEVTETQTETQPQPETPTEPQPDTENEPVTAAVPVEESAEEIIEEVVEPPVRKVEETKLETVTKQIEKKKVVSSNRFSLYDRAVVAVSRQLDRLKEDQLINIGCLAKIGQEFVGNIHDTKSLEVRALNRRKTTSIANRIVNMTVFSALIGNKMRLSEDDMMILIQTAILHDFGMSLVPKKILETKHKVSKREYAEIKKHIDHSVNAILSAEDYDVKDHNSIVKITKQVHEREDGSGYPLGLESDDIDRLAKIIAVCDRYEAMSHPRCYRKPFIAHVAMQKIVKLKQDELNPKAIKALLQALSIFPIDSFVKLNNNQIGRVVGINKSHPMRPIVMILKDEKNVGLAEPIELDLKESPFLFITASLQPEDVE